MGATARDVMNPEVIAVHENMTVRELAAFLSERQITGAPVVDRKGHLVGVVSLADIADAEGEQGHVVPDEPPSRVPDREWADRFSPEELVALHVEPDETLVRDIMTPAVYTITEDTPVETIARAMIAGRIHRLFVTRRHQIVGIVTSLDLLKLVAGPQARRVRPRRTEART